MSKTNRTLALHVETVRELTNGDLNFVGGSRTIVLSGDKLGICYQLQSLINGQTTCQPFCTAEIVTFQANC